MKITLVTLVTLVTLSAVIICLLPIKCHVEDLNLTTGQLEANNSVLEIDNESVKDKITRLSIENGFDVNTALRIAECESQYGKFIFNQKSSAKGIYQFIDSTWDHYCKGDVLNEEDNILCFIKLYEKNKSWWSCR